MKRVFDILFASFKLKIESYDCLKFEIINLDNSINNINYFVILRSTCMNVENSLKKKNWSNERE